MSFVFLFQAQLTVSFMLIVHFFIALTLLHNRDTGHYSCCRSLTHLSLSGVLNEWVTVSIITNYDNITIPHGSPWIKIVSISWIPPTQNVQWISHWYVSQDIAYTKRNTVFGVDLKILIYRVHEFDQMFLFIVGNQT